MFAGRIHRLRGNQHCRLGERHKDSTGVKPARTALRAEDILPVEVGWLDVRYRRVSAVGATGGGPYSETSLGEVLLPVGDIVAAVDGPEVARMGHPAATRTVSQHRDQETALARFGSIDALVNNAGIFFTKPFIDYTIEDYRRLAATNLEGFLHLTQRVVRQMLAQKSGGSIVSITTPMVDHPIAGVNASVAMLTKGGIEAMSKNIAMEYAKEQIRANTVAPGVVDTPLHKDNPKDFLKTLSPMHSVSSVREIVDAVLFLTEAPRITGEVLHVDGGAHLGRW